MIHCDSIPVPKQGNSLGGCQQNQALRNPIG